MAKTEPAVKPEVKTKPDIKHKKEPDIKLKHDVKKPDMNKITYEEEKVALILGTTAVFTVW